MSSIASPTPRVAIVPNYWNLQLRQRANLLTRAYRGPIAPGCALPPLDAPNAQVQRKSLIHVPINCNTAGDNQVIPTLVGRKLLYEIFIWNVTAQTLALYQGPSGSNNGILLVRLTNFPALSGFTLGFNGSFLQAHFDIDPGQPVVLNLQNSTQVDGFIRYRTEISGNF